MRLFRWLLFHSLLLSLLGAAAAQALPEAGHAQFLPFVTTATAEPLTEFRGLWVTRFDWTTFNEAADPAKIDEIVANAAAAHFNVILFQVRGTADAYYTPGLEPWAQRVSGQKLGQPPDPLWDPLGRLIEKAHAAGIQVHAYINVYPVWSCGSPPDPDTTPTHFYYQLRDFHGTTDGKLNGVEWATNGNVVCGTYLRGIPASPFVNDHLIAVGQDLVTRYDLDGLHLDHIRYSDIGVSCDPVTLFYYQQPCFDTADFANWQREQVNHTVRRFYTEVVPLKPNLWLSAAVWPIHTDKWGWGARQGYYDYYQDSKAWAQGGYIDSISPMIYSSNFDTDTFWTQDKWQTLVADFLAESGDRYVIPGIGGGYSDFAEIEARIAYGRAIGVPGYAIFSYSSLAQQGYFDDLANGPQAQPAVLPPLPWRTPAAP